MPRYTAIIETSFGEIGPDLIEAGDQQEAIENARRLAEMLARGAFRHSLDAGGWHVSLRDEQGGTVGTVLLKGLGRETAGRDGGPEPDWNAPQRPRIPGADGHD